MPHNIMKLVYYRHLCVISRFFLIKERGRLRILKILTRVDVETLTFWPCLDRCYFRSAKRFDICNKGLNPTIVRYLAVLY